MPAASVPAGQHRLEPRSRHLSSACVRKGAAHPHGAHSGPRSPARLGPPCRWLPPALRSGREGEFQSRGGLAGAGWGPGERVGGWVRDCVWSCVDQGYLFHGVPTPDSYVGALTPSTPERDWAWRRGL